MALITCSVCSPNEGTGLGLMAGLLLLSIRVGEVPCKVKGLLKEKSIFGLSFLTLSTVSPVSGFLVFLTLLTSFATPKRNGD